jgi:hypothetical protein
MNVDKGLQLVLANMIIIRARKHEKLDTNAMISRATLPHSPVNQDDCTRPVAYMALKPVKIN